jgi:hypothetical protein
MKAKWSVVHYTEYTRYLASNDRKGFEVYFQIPKDKDAKYMFVHISVFFKDSSISEKYFYTGLYGLELEEIKALVLERVEASLGKIRAEHSSLGLC